MLKHTLIALLSVVMIFSAVGVAGAQDPDGNRRRGDRVGEGQLLAAALLQETADQLGVTLRDLTADVEDGQTINDVIVANGGDVAAVTAAVEAQFVERLDTALANERIDQERYDEMVAGIDAAMDEALARPAPQTVRERVRTGVELRMDNAILNLVSEETGLTRQEVFAQLREGKTIGVVITENGGDLDAISGQIVAGLTDRINEAVENGTIDQERADTLLSDLETRVDEWLSRTERPDREFGDGFGAADDSGEGVIE